MSTWKMVVKMERGRGGEKKEKADTVSITEFCEKVAMLSVSMKSVNFIITNNGHNAVGVNVV